MMIFYYKQIIYTACIFLSATSGLFRKAHRKHFFTTICATFKDSTRIAPVVTTQANDNKDVESSFARWFDDSLIEVETPIALKIIGGPFPSFLSGILIKNGPASFGEVEIQDGELKSSSPSPSSSSSRRRYNHLFDGLAKLTKYEFTKEGRILFTSKFLHSSIYKRVVKEKGSLPPSVSAGPVVPPFSTFEQLVGLFTSGGFDNVPVNVAQVGGTDGPWVGITDAPILLEFDLEDLSTKKLLKYRNAITSVGGVELFSTAHPCYDRKGGNLYNYFLECRPLGDSSNKAHIVKTNKNLERTIVGTVELGKGVIPYIHDFSVTDNYAVLFEYPLRMSLDKFLSDKGFFPQMEWLGDRGGKTRIHVFDLRNSEKKSPVRTFEAPAMFAYHHVNAFEDNEAGQIVLDITGYDTPDIATSAHAFAYIHNMLDRAAREKQVKDGRCYRFRLPLPNASTLSSSEAFVSPTILSFTDKEGISYTSEMVRVSDSRKGSYCRYSYGMTGFAGHESDPSRGGFLKWALIKRDHALAESIARTAATTTSTATSTSTSRSQQSTNPSSSTTALVWREDHCYTSEPIFVSNPAGSSEDDGVVLSEVYDGNKRESFLLVLDGITMKEIARAYIGQIRPYPFHGMFVKK